VAHWGLIANVVAVVPISVAVFLATGLLEGRDPAHAQRRDGLFRRLETPVDRAAEVEHAHDPTSEVFRFLSRSTAVIGVLALLLIGNAAPGDRATLFAYVGITLALAWGLSWVRGSEPARSAREVA
jgi:hypothetical protein